MRTATLAKLGLTALVGLGTLVGSADLAQAGPGPQQGPGKLGPATTSTTMAPLPADEVDQCDVQLCLPAEEVEPNPCAPVECIPADPADPTPHDDDLPIAQPEYDDDCKLPSCDKAPPPQGGGDPDPGCSPMQAACDELTQPEPGCTTTHGCEGEGTGGSDGGGTGGSDGGTGGTDGGSGSTDGTTSSGPSDDGGSRGDGPLPRTGGDVATLLGAGLGLTGIGAAARKLARRQR